MVDDCMGVVVEEVWSVCERVFSSDETSMSETRPKHSKGLRIKILNEIAGGARSCFKSQFSRILETTKRCQVQNRRIGRYGNDQDEKCRKSYMRNETGYLHDGGLL
jgi:hypothetical protein